MYRLYIGCMSKKTTIQASWLSCQMPLTMRQLRQPLTIEAVNRGQHFADKGETLQTYIQESFNYNLCYFISTEIYCLYCRFSYLLAKKLYKVLKCFKYNNINKKAINYLTKYCSFCQKYRYSLSQFKFTLYKDLDFNYSVYIDIIYINGSLVLYIINEVTCY